MRTGGFLPVATLTVVFAVACGQYQHNQYQRPDYVEQPYRPPYSSHRQPQSPYPAAEYPSAATTGSYHRQPSYQQPARHYQSSHSSGYGSEPQGYPAAPSQQYNQKPQQPYQQPAAYPSTSNYGSSSYEPEKPAYAAICDFNTGAGSDKNVKGRLILTQQGKGYDAPVKISGHISNLKPGEHGFHIHMYSDFSDGCKSAGPHYNPLKVSHGSPQNDQHYRHIGDLGNIEAGYDGVAQIDIDDPLVSLADGGKFPIAGRSIVVHEKPDDLGRGGDEESTKTGNAGGRLRCCNIRYVDPAKLPKEY